MALVRPDPFRDVDRLFQQLAGAQQGRQMQMPLDAFRKGDTFLITLDLPGVSADSVDLTVEDNVLTIKAERPAPPKSEEVEVLIAERLPTAPMPARCFSERTSTPSTSTRSIKLEFSPCRFRLLRTPSRGGSKYKVGPRANSSPLRHNHPRKSRSGRPERKLCHIFWGGHRRALATGTPLEQS